MYYLATHRYAHQVKGIQLPAIHDNGLHSLRVQSANDGRCTVH
jgi:hypothetical protein